MPPPSALLTLLQYKCTTNAQYTTPTRPPLCTPYTIQYWQWQYRVKANTQSTNSVVRLHQTHAVSHTICGLCVLRRCPVVSLSLRVYWESQLQDLSCLLTQQSPCLLFGSRMSVWPAALTPYLPISTPLSRATNRLKRTRRFLFPSRARDSLYSKRAAPYVNAPSPPLFVIYTSRSSS